MSGTLKAIAGPAFISNSVANLYTPEASTIYTVIHHIHIVNKTASDATFTMYIGTTGGSTSGTEIFKDHNVVAKGEFDYFCVRKMLSTQFLTAIASAASTLVVTVDGEFFVV